MKKKKVNRVEESRLCKESRASVTAAQPHLLRASPLILPYSETLSLLTWAIAGT